MAYRYSHRNLIMWRKAQELAAQIIDIASSQPGSWSNAVLARQIISSATSVSANIAEGHGRFALGAHRNHLSIARGSAAETDSWIDLLRRRNWISALEESELSERCNELMRMLTSKMRELDRLASEQPRTRETNAPYHVHEESRPWFPFVDSDYDTTSDTTNE